MTTPEHCSESNTAICSRKNGAEWRLQTFGFRSLVLDNGEVVERPMERPRLKERDMNATNDAMDLYVAALTSDATTLMRRLGFDDRIGRKRLCDLISDLYTTELMVIVQLVRWYEIGVLKPYERDVPHPAVLMTDLRRRVAMSPKEYVASSELLRSLGRMMAWWSENTVTTAWRSVKTHVRVAGPPDHLCDTVADFLWELRDVLVAATGQNTESKEVQR